MKVTIYLNANDTMSPNNREVRSAQTHLLLCLCDSTGLWLFDRKSRSQHRLSWEEIDELRKAVNVGERPTNTHLNVIRATG